ncbi:VanW family protein [Paenibacillus sp. S-38]|uniref:VanW family protein n=1 Tax=Paenibacillus sp. S-38 TaxID=3416710 RepID=UPI003CEBB896
MNLKNPIPAPKDRSPLRLAAGIAYYRARRRLQWLISGSDYASERSRELLPYVLFTHRTPLLRQLKDVDMRLQYNKVTNLRLAAARIDGLLLRPEQTFSYWKTIGRPTRAKGYLEGMVLHRGTVRTGIGGGLCQLSNLLYWMMLHTPAAITERYRHGYDVFPDAGRTQPFGTGATCFYNYLDLQAVNGTESLYQISLELNDTHLIGSWRSDRPAMHRYEIVEKKHWFTQELWGGYIRHNTIWRNVWNAEGRLLEQQHISDNHAIMMYDPSLPPEMP